MTDYAAPILDARFNLEVIADYRSLAASARYADASLETALQVLEEAGRFAAGVLAPLNRIGDLHGSVLENGVVHTPPGWREAYRDWTDGGWNALPFDPAHGGTGLPWVLAFAVQEFWQSANMSFALCGLLNQGAVDLLQAHGDPAQQAMFLPRMVAGTWTGTMNLTEPQAGSDVGAIITRAVPDGTSGAWRITGQKIYITYGDHDLTDNVIHLVLARTPGAPPGPKGISLFVVPKVLVGADGRLGARNDLRCVSLEHKLGINASPTAVMSFGDNEGARGWLIGEENRGLEYMFTMMNNARLSVGLQGVAIGERAYQQARAYAHTRVQGRTASGEKAPIVQHPDVRRMLGVMKARIEAMRGLTCYVGAAIDRAHAAADAAERAAAQATVDLLTPVVKAWNTDLGVEVTSECVQIHGGMGFIEETGAAQHYRDARILPIYEGTNGIQALDLLSRKLLRDGGAAAARLIEVWSAPTGATPAVQAALDGGLADLRSATTWLLDTAKGDMATAQAAATPYLRLWGTVAGGWVMAKGDAAAGNGGDWPTPFRHAKRQTAAVYATQELSRSGSLRAQVVGAGAVLALPAEAL